MCCSLHGPSLAGGMDGMGHHDAGGRTGALGGPQAVVSSSGKLMQGQVVPLAG